MKSCPSCQRQYEDETMRFCLEDGALLTDLNQKASGSDAESTLLLPQQGVEPPSTLASPPPPRSTMTTPGFIRMTDAGQVAGSASRSDQPRYSPVWWVVLALIVGGSGIVIALVVTRDRRRESIITGSPTASAASPSPAPSKAPSAPAASTDAEPAKSKIAGEWRLWREGQLQGKVVTTMRITANGSNISVSGRGWTGRGSFDGQRGYYDWQFTDGKRGRTTIRLDADDKLHGEVRGSGIDWNYQAARR